MFARPALGQDSVLAEEPYLNRRRAIKCLGCGIAVYLRKGEMAVERVESFWGSGWSYSVNLKTAVGGEVFSRRGAERQRMRRKMRI